MYGYDSYKANDIETASPVKLIVMLYAGAIKFSNIAIAHIEKNDIEGANTNILKAQNIISELLASINFEAGGIADDLSNLYIYLFDGIAVVLSCTTFKSNNVCFMWILLSIFAFMDHGKLHFIFKLDVLDIVYIYLHQIIIHMIFQLDQVSQFSFIHGLFIKLVTGSGAVYKMEF